MFPFNCALLWLAVVLPTLTCGKMMFPRSASRSAGPRPIPRSAGLSYSSPLDLTASNATSYRITSLPGSPSDAPSWPQYSGYVTVDAVHGGHLFFWLTESVSAFPDTPWFIWLNGTFGGYWP